MASRVHRGTLEKTRFCPTHTSAPTLNLEVEGTVAIGHTREPEILGSAISGGEAQFRELMSPALRATALVACGPSRATRCGRSCRRADGQSVEHLSLGHVGPDPVRTRRAQRPVRAGSSARSTA